MIARGSFKAGDWSSLGAVGLARDYNNISDVITNGNFEATSSSHIGAVGRAGDGNTLCHVTANGTYKGGDFSSLGAVGCAGDGNTLGDETTRGTYKGGDWSSLGTVGFVFNGNALSDVTTRGTFKAGEQSELGAVGCAGDGNTLSDVTTRGTFKAGNRSDLGWAFGSVGRYNRVMLSENEIRSHDSQNPSKLKLIGNKSDDEALERIVKIMKSPPKVYARLPYGQRVGKAFTPMLNRSPKVGSGYFAVNDDGWARIYNMGELKPENLGVALAAAPLGRQMSDNVYCKMINEHFPLEEGRVITKAGLFGMVSLFKTPAGSAFLKKHRPMQGAGGSSTTTGSEIVGSEIVGSESEHKSNW